jgi:hypothetical protein
MDKIEILNNIPLSNDIKDIIISYLVNYKFLYKLCINQLNDRFKNYKYLRYKQTNYYKFVLRDSKFKKKFLKYK